MVIVTCKVCKMLSFTLCVFVLFHVTKKKSEANGVTTRSQHFLSGQFCNFLLFDLW